MKLAWVKMDGSATSAREGLAVDAERQGYRVLSWGAQPLVRQSGDACEWLCDVERLDGD